MKIRSTLTFVAIATALAACGSTASASSTKTTTDLTSGTPTTVSAACNPATPVPPKVMPKSPTASSCWAAGFYLGEGSLHNKTLIWVDKQANYSIDQLTPQLIRTDPAKATLVEKVLAQYATPKAQNETMRYVTPLAKSGDSLVPTGKAPTDPTGLLYTYPDVLVGGISDIPQNGPSTTAPTQAQVGECVNQQIYLVGPNNLPVAGEDGYYGYLKWTDELIKTSVGWQVDAFGIGLKETQSC